MAIEKKLKDPGEAALSAVEQALNLDPPDDGRTAMPRGDLGPRLPDINDGDLLQPSSRPVDLDGPAADAEQDRENAARHRGRPPLLTPDRATVANDDRQSDLPGEPSDPKRTILGPAQRDWLGLGGRAPSSLPPEGIVPCS